VCAGAAGLRGAIPAAWPLVRGGEGVQIERGGGVFIGGLGLGEGLGMLQTNPLKMKLALELRNG
jgi:hypothetical protein